MKLRIISQYHTLAYELGSQIERRMDASVTIEGEEVEFSLWIRDGLPAAVVGELLGAIAPFAPTVGIDKSLSDSDWDALLCLGTESGTSQTPLQVHLTCADTDYAADLASDLCQAGFAAKCIEPVWPEQNIVAFGKDVPEFHRALVLWILKQRGVVPRFAKGGVKDNEIGVILRPIQEASAQLLFPIELRCDDMSYTAEIVADGLAGFSAVPSLVAPKARFQLELGALRSREFAAARLALEQSIGELMQQVGIDLLRHPLKVKANKDMDVPVPAKTVLHLPIAALQAGTLRPYAGDYPDRLTIELRSDDLANAIPLADGLRNRGFSITELVLPVEEVREGFLVKWGMAEECPRQKQAIANALRGYMQDCEMPVGYRLREEAGDVKQSTVRIDLPIKAGCRGTLPDRRGAGFNFKLTTEDPDGWDELLAQVRTWDFDQFKLEHSKPVSLRIGAGPTVRYGGAPKALLSDLVELLGKEGIEVYREKAWADSDNDVWLELPPHPSRTRKTQETSAAVSPALTSTSLVPPGDALVASLLKLTATQVSLGDYTLDRRTDVADDDPLLPAVDPAKYCLDAPTVETLKHLAISMHLRQPVLLEGATSTSKTSSILYLAALLRQPVIQLNLNGQSDTGELVGRFGPSATDEAEVKGINRVWQLARRLFGREEKSPWQWIDGVVTRAMQQGAWLILDEVNLAEPQVLERLNPVLERNARLLLSERDGRLIAGDQVHPEFRVFATMNPAEYSGRSVLSPAWRNRFGGYRYCFAPTERDYLHMLEFLVYGEQPTVPLGDDWVRGPGCAAPNYAELGAISETRKVLEALARFHMSMIGISGSEGDGTARLAVRRKERPVFTRRDLMNVLDFLHERLSATGKDRFSLGLAVDEAIAMYYANRLDSPTDRDTVRSLQEANGLTAIQIHLLGARLVEVETLKRKTLLTSMESAS